MAGRVSLLDYGAGNVRSLRNAIRELGYEIDDISTAEEIAAAKVIVFPGVGSFGQAMQSLRAKGWTEALKAYLKADRPFFGICLGMQSLFEGSEESPGEEGLGIIPGQVTKFLTTSSSSGASVRVPQIGWNGVSPVKDSPLLETITGTSDTVYFVHSFCAMPTEANLDWILTLTDYGDQRYISSVQKGNVCAAQFHPEKSGTVGLAVLRSFLSRSGIVSSSTSPRPPLSLADLASFPKTQIVKRVIACLDVRSNDHGDLVVTKGDQYDVREAAADGKGEVRNLGKPVALCSRYYQEGADEVVFLNITSFRSGVLEDTPMLRVLELASENVFVPLTVGGGIREYTDPSGQQWSALDVAARYFRAGADKVSIGSDAVAAAEAYLASGVKTGTSCLEQISNHYGAQAVVVSIDPKRVYVADPATDTAAQAAGYTVVRLDPGDTGPNGEEWCWWAATIKGGRETRPIDAVQLARSSEALGAGEIMLNCIDMDGQGKGYDHQLIAAVQSAVSVPVIGSSGAGAVQHFSQVFSRTGVMAALAAGIFHRNEVRIADVKQHLYDEGVPCRRAPSAV